MNKPLISLIVPVFNEEDNIEPFRAIMEPILLALSTDFDFEIIFLDNHSTDKTFYQLKQVRIPSVRIKVIRFSRNFGYQRSIYTGYVHAKGNAAIQIDIDLQDPPELIREFLNKWQEGYKVVYGIRRTRKEGWLITRTRALFYWLIDKLSDCNLPCNAGDFRLVDACVLHELRKHYSMRPYLRGEIALLGFKQTGIEYDRNKRNIGESKFNFREYCHLAVDGIVSHSITPLRIASYTALAISIITFITMLIYFIGKLLFSVDWPAGFATTTALILLSITLNACFLGIIGEYLGRIYLQVNKREVTVIEELIEL